MYGANCRASSNLMQWTYASLRSFTPYCPRFPTPSHRLLSIENTCTTLAGDGSSRYKSCARQSTKIEGQPFRVDPLFRQSASSHVRFFSPGYWLFVAVDGLMQLRYMSILRSELSDAVNLSSFHSSIFYCPAHQVPWEDRKPYNKKRHTLRCAFKQSATSYPPRPSPAKYFRRL